MERRALGRSGLEVSALALGTMNFGADWHGIGAVDEKTAACLLDLALERGVTLVDTADIYGRGASEEMLGRLLKKRRGRVLLATKVLGEMRPGDRSSGGLSARHIEEALEDSLRRLRTDHVDLYMPHGIDPEVPAEESLAAFDRLKRAGKVRAVGVSNFNAEHLQLWLGHAAARGWARPEFDQVQYSLAARFAEPDALAVCAMSGVSALAWSPLGGGLLTGKYARPGAAGRRTSPEAFPRLPDARLGALVELLGKVAQLDGLTAAQAALGWLLAKPVVASAVVGARTAAQLEETLGARPLSPRALALLDRGSAAAAV
jgi:aryl-alcohol dehydrogenase-like predicted oxidoreductase